MNEQSEMQVRVPRSAAAFDFSRAGHARWKAEALERGIGDVGIFRAFAEDLLLYCATWYNNHDCITSPRFAARWAIARKELPTMARNAKNNAPKRADWKGFLDYRLTEDELNELQEWQPTPAEIWESVDTLLQGDYRVTLSYSSATKIATCSIIDDSRERASGGWALSSAHVDGAQALKAAVFKHFLKFNGDWTPLLDAGAPTGRIG